MKRIIKFIFMAMLAILCSSQVFSETREKPISVIQLNKEFYTNFSRSSPIERDILLNKMLNEVLQGRGYVESVEKIERYHRNYRIVAIESEALNLNIRFYIFTDNEEYPYLLKKGDFFDFKGQFIIYTPLSSRRDSYIFDIVLEDGALVVK